jgi:hypothetical protein
MTTTVGNNDGIMLYKFKNQNWQIAGNPQKGFDKTIMETFNLEPLTNVRKSECFWIYVD